MKDAATNLEFEEAAKIRDEIRNLEASELEIVLNPKVKHYNQKIEYIQKVDQRWVYLVQEHKKVKKNGSKQNNYYWWCN